ncbi:hypothetical protein DS745_21560 [Anaerobacillus alkaliphilus]|uniref:Uncharacterized protein n=2 Tax=Anaerobacillus alkaliphilus TaxID=1548597 RepID=A0A4Q0VMQ0_9BACI|nr:hypothetical protein DS745_21560 [Anaerobacillus alkaliphilus]
MCPKCRQNNTYDIIPDLPNIPELQLSKDSIENADEITIGNSKFYCINCDYTWKKYRGKKIYEQIKVIYAYAGGFPGPYFEVKIDLKTNDIEKNEWIEYHIEDQEAIIPTKELIEWFRSELHKCDIVNWAEKYFAYAMDGTHWSVRIEYENYCEIKRGSNHFPLKWGKFCRAISKVSGGGFF